mgnify:CR=1 FL=1
MRVTGGDPSAALRMTKKENLFRSQRSSASARAIEASCNAKLSHTSKAMLRPPPTRALPQSRHSERGAFARLSAKNLLATLASQTLILPTMPTPAHFILISPLPHPKNKKHQPMLVFLSTYFSTPLSLDFWENFFLSSFSFNSSFNFSSRACTFSASAFNSRSIFFSIAVIF